MEIKALSPTMARDAEAMTFPAFRHLLSLEPVRATAAGIETTDADPTIRPLAIGAVDRDRLVGLALATYSAAGQPARLLSLFVEPAHRRTGIGSALVAAAEAALARHGMAAVEAVYTTGTPSASSVEHILALRDWQPPRTHGLVVRFTPHEAMKAAWFDRVGLPHGGSEILAWTDVTAEERLEIRRSHERVQWIAPGLEPWRYDGQPCDAASSVALRYRGAIVGWVINHRLSAEFVRFTCSFMRVDLSRHGRILPLYCEAIRRVSRTACRVCSLVTPMEYAEMARFLHRRCAGAVHFFGETRGAIKMLEARS